MEIDPKLLRYLLAITRSGSFGRAAAMLGVWQPALSVTIARLEDVVGAPVMERGGGAPS
jgi:DNA-binding transcriptional LysR family regulator